MNAIIAQILVGVVLGLIASIFKPPRPESFEQPRRDDLRERLRDKVRKAGFLLSVLLVTQGCRQTAIYVPTGEPVRLLQNLRNVKVEVIGPDGPCARRQDIPQGWYVLPDGFDD